MVPNSACLRGAPEQEGDSSFSREHSEESGEGMRAGNTPPQTLRSAQGDNTVRSVLSAAENLRPSPRPGLPNCRIARGHPKSGGLSSVDKIPASGHSAGLGFPGFLPEADAQLVALELGPQCGQALEKVRQDDVPLEVAGVHHQFIGVAHERQLLLGHEG